MGYVINTEKIYCKRELISYGTYVNPVFNGNT